MTRATISIILIVLVLILRTQCQSYIPLWKGKKWTADGISHFLVGLLFTKCYKNFKAIKSHQNMTLKKGESWALFILKC